MAKPQNNFITTSNKVDVSGKTDSDATVKINNQLVLVNDDGIFNEEIEVFEGTKAIEIIATSRSGKQTKIIRDIIVK